MRVRGALSAAVISVCLAPNADAADGESACTASRMMFVLDKSSSMTRLLGDRMMWDIAAEALGEVARAYDDRVEVGLNVFPEAGRCSPGTVLVDPARGTADAIVASLADPPPDAGNYTPMSQTLDAVRVDPSLGDLGARRHVVLITDGWQWCDPYDPSTRFDPVDSVDRLSQAGIITYVVGFGDGVDAAALNQMAVSAGTDRPGCDPAGEAPDSPDPCYYHADSPAELLAALMDVAGQVSQEEQCNGLDDDCDGLIDEELSRDCDGGCGVETCEAGAWGQCVSECGAGEVCEAGQCVDETEPPADDPMVEPDDPYGVSGGGCAIAPGWRAERGGTRSASGIFLCLGAFLWAFARRRASALAAGLAFAIAFGGTAEAQTGFSVERFRPATDRDGVLDIEWADVPRHLDFDLALWFAAADDPLIAYRDVDGQHERIGSLVSRRVGADLVGAVGLWDRLQVGVDVPLIVSQEQDPSLTGAMPTETRYKIGDVRLAPKLRLYRGDGVAVAVIATVSLPTAAEGEYLGEAGTIFAPELAVSGRSGDWRFAGNAGYRVRGRAEMVNLVVDDELIARLGAAYRIDGSIELASSLGLATSAQDPVGAANANYAELLAGVSFGLGESVAAFVGGGAGLQEGFGAPDWRIVGGVRWYRRTREAAPPPPRRPVVAREPDPPQAEEEAEEEEPLAVLKEDTIEILESIHFRVDEAVIEEESYPILDSVARILRRHKELTLVRIEGHCDATASDLYNDGLSQRRAEAVREYLGNMGVDEARLDAVGFGETQPIDSNDTIEGRAANRRVQFVIVQRKEPAQPDDAGD